MARGLSQAYRQAAQENGALLADVGNRFFELADTQNLYASDGVHPNERGTRLAAQTLAQVMQQHQKTRP